MNKSYFIRLLHNYFNGNASKEEQEFLISYYDLFGSQLNKSSDVLLKKKEEEGLKSLMEADIWEKIRIEEQQKNAKEHTPKLWIAVAAVTLIIFSTALYFLNSSPEKSKNIISRTDHSSEHRLIRLPDGSLVIINAGSKFNYPSTFDGLAKREVYLEGQAYFDIKHNADKPFIIHTGQLETTVLGTAFNIKAWPADKDITVTVSRGKVKVRDLHQTFGAITPNQQIIYTKQKAVIVKKDVQASQYVAWKEQDLLLDNITIAEAAELLETRFKVSILISDLQIGTNRFTTTLKKGEFLEDVLMSICEFNGAKYQYDKEKASVIIKGK